MNTAEYIRRELELMKSDCRRMNISAEEWVSRYAKRYHQLHAQEINAAVKV